MSLKLPWSMALGACIVVLILLASGSAFAFQCHLRVYAKVTVMEWMDPEYSDVRSSPESNSWQECYRKAVEYSKKFDAVQTVNTLSTGTVDTWLYVYWARGFYKGTVTRFSDLDAPYWGDRKVFRNE